MDHASLVPAGDWRADGGMAPLTLRPTLQATWALICGCVASGLLRGDGATLLRVTATWLIADATLGSVLAQLLALKRAALAYSGSRSGDEPPLLVMVPYAAVGSPGYRLALRLDEHIARWRQWIWPHAGRSGVMALVGTGLSLVVATYLGRTMLAAVSAGLLAAALCAALAGRDQASLARWFSGLHLALAWALGYLALATWRGPWLGLALLVGLYAYARERLKAEEGRGARWLVMAIWAVWVVMLLAARQPILAAAVASASLLDALAVGEGASAVHAAGDRLARYGAHTGRLGWFLATLLTAMAVAHWP